MCSVWLLPFTGSINKIVTAGQAYISLPRLLQRCIHWTLIACIHHSVQMEPNGPLIDLTGPFGFILCSQELNYCQIPALLNLQEESTRLEDCRRIVILTNVCLSSLLWQQHQYSIDKVFWVQINNGPGHEKG